jgi:hypothetical protein
VEGIELLDGGERRTQERHAAVLKLKRGALV